MNNKPVEQLIDHHPKISEAPNPAADNDARILSQPADRYRIEEHSNIIFCSQKIFIAFTKLHHNFCNYCTLAQSPFKNHHSFMTPDEVLVIIKQGEASGCKEVLFTLGEKTDLRYSSAREELANSGHEKTLP